MKCFETAFLTKFSLDSLLLKLNVDPSFGLSNKRVNIQRSLYGSNILKQMKKVSVFEILVRQLKSIVVLLLITACLFSFYSKNSMEGTAILVVIILNTLIGFITELKATRSMEALAKIGVTTDVVIREGKTIQIPSDELVVADIVKLEAGDIVSADIRLIISSNLKVDESSFTGESLPVEKDFLSKVESEQICDIKNMVFRGSNIISGSALGIVVNIGMCTEIGKIAKLTYATKDEVTPLEKKINFLGKRLVELAFLMSLLVAVFGIISGRDLFLMIEVAIALTIAAIPEGLPIVATLALAKGMLIMARKNVLINKLSAVETLGATTTIFTDKTGTLTENKMKVISLWADEFEEKFNFDEEIFKKALQVSTLCNSASIQINPIGDTMELALLNWAKEYDLEKEKLLQTYRKVKEYAFDFHKRMMATIHENEKFFYAIKGAPEEIISSCNKVYFNGISKSFSDDQKNKWIHKNEILSSQGSRLLALAFKESFSYNDNPYQNLVFLGLVEIKDPPVEGIEYSIDQCHKAGINIVMLTGDHKGTAISIAHKIHITDNNTVITGNEFEQIKKSNEPLILNNCKVFARVNPLQKLELIDIYQKQGQIVAMTGDGVNDAPALKKADIGIAMGIRGTQVAKEASDIILKDDCFFSIVSAIFQGRVIYNNIRYFVIYLISCNMSEILSVGIASISNLPLPIKPLHILFLNLVTDVFPALALGLGKGDQSYMLNSPRKVNENIITTHLWGKIIGFGLLITMSVLGSLIYAVYFLKVENKVAVTISFFTMAFAQLFHVFNVRNTNSSIIKNDIVMNPFIWIAIFICTILMLLTLYVPILKDVMNLEKLNVKEAFGVLIFSLFPVVFIQISNEFVKKYILKH